MQWKLIYVVVIDYCKKLFVFRKSEYDATLDISKTFEINSVYLVVDVFKFFSLVYIRVPPVRFWWCLSGVWLFQHGLRLMRTKERDAGNPVMINCIKFKMTLKPRPFWFRTQIFATNFYFNFFFWVFRRRETLSNYL